VTNDVVMTDAWLASNIIVKACIARERYARYCLDENQHDDYVAALMRLFEAVDLWTEVGQERKEK